MSSRSPGSSGQRKNSPRRAQRPQRFSRLKTKNTNQGSSQLFEIRSEIPPALPFPKEGELFNACEERFLFSPFEKGDEGGFNDFSKNKFFPQSNYDDLVKSRNSIEFVIPAKAGIQLFQDVLDPGFRRGDGLFDFLRSHQTMEVNSSLLFDTVFCPFNLWQYFLCVLCGLCGEFLCPCSAHESLVSGVHRGCAQLFLDAHELVVFLHPLAAAGRAGLEMTGGHRHSEVGNEAVHRLA